MKPSPAPCLRQSPSLHRWSLITPPDDLCHPIVLPATQNNSGFVSSRMPGQGDEHISCSCPLQTTWNKNMTHDCDEIKPGGHRHYGCFPLKPSVWPRWWSALLFSLSLPLYRWSVRRSSARGSLPRCWGIKRGAPFRWSSSKRCRIARRQKEEKTQIAPGTWGCGFRASSRSSSRRTRLIVRAESKHVQNGASIRHSISERSLEDDA